MNLIAGHIVFQARAFQDEGPRCNNWHAGHVHAQPGMWKLKLLSVKATNRLVLINLLLVIFYLKCVVRVQLVAADCLYQADRHLAPVRPHATLLHPPPHRHH